MSSTLSSSETSTDEQELIGQLARSAVTELGVSASVGGSAEVMQIKDAELIRSAHPYAPSLIKLDSRLHGPHVAEPAVGALPATIGPFNTGSITFNNGVPVGGFASLTLHSDGTCQFNGHFHVSGAPSYNVELVWVIADSGGNAYTFTASGKVHGTFESGSRDFNWNQSQVNGAVAANWPKLVQGWRYQWNAHVNWDVTAAVNSAVDALRAAGQIIGAVISVVAIFA